jgi:hypothetical protein
VGRARLLHLLEALDGVDDDVLAVGVWVIWGEPSGIKVVT